MLAGPFLPLPPPSVSLYCEAQGVACICVCVCVCVWEEDRLPTCKWRAIIRRSVTRGYVRQLKLCFLTETWFMLLVVTVTTSKRDRSQTQTKAGEINADSVQPFCWYPLPFNQSTYRLSGEEAPPHSGSFLSPGAARWNHAGWSCVHKKTRPPGQGCLISLPGLPSVSDAPGGTELVTSTVAQNSLWLLLRKAATWVFGSATQLTLLKWCSAALLEEERMEWDLSWCQCFITASPKTWMEVDWLSAPTHRELFPHSSGSHSWDFIDLALHRMQSTFTCISLF